MRFHNYFYFKRRTLASNEMAMASCTKDLTRLEKIDGAQSRWRAATAQGQDVGIVCGADTIALRK
jgi:hypothetical protein